MSKTYITVILDKSGSMEGIQKDTIGGFNAFLSEQKEKLDGEVEFMLVQFDTSVQPFKHIPLHRAKKLTTATYTPYGGTALLDAVGQTLDYLEERVEHGDKSIVTIITDGEENSSRTYKTEQIKKAITHLQKGHDWTFLFLGANQDAWSVAQTYGIHKVNTVTWEPQYTQSAFYAASSGTMAAAAGASMDMEETYKQAVEDMTSN